uniref:Putative secreted protein n=1 Tax=Anopheles darlingi TaxID=43151 RepID=A0A2M4D925_ANODA
MILCRRTCVRYVCVRACVRACNGVFLRGVLVTRMNFVNFGTNRNTQRKWTTRQAVGLQQCNWNSNCTYVSVATDERFSFLDCKLRRGPSCANELHNHGSRVSEG